MIPMLVNIVFSAVISAWIDMLIFLQLFIFNTVTLAVVNNCTSQLLQHISEKSAGRRLVFERKVRRVQFLGAAMVLSLNKLYWHKGAQVE